MKNIVAVGVLSLGTLLLAGCTGKPAGPEVVNVEGKVLVDGEPMENLRVEVGTVSNELVIDDAGLVETHSYAGGKYFVENPGWLAGGAVSWARELFAFDNDRQLDAAAAEVPAGADGLLFVPALTGAMAPRWNADVRASFVGLTSAHGRGHMARAILEGCAFAMRDVQLGLERLGLGPETIVALGGGAASDTWLEIRAHVSGLEVAGAEAADSCPLGAAVLAISCEQGQKVEEVASQIVLRKRHFTPKVDVHREYTAAHQRYRELFDALEPLF